VIDVDSMQLTAIIPVGEVPKRISTEIIR
jgi:hypothetical protein